MTRLRAPAPVEGSVRTTLFERRERIVRAALMRGMAVESVTNFEAVVDRELMNAVADATESAP